MNENLLSNPVDQVRRQVVGSLFETATLSKAWPIWRPQLQAVIGKNPTVDTLLAIDGDLARIFRSTGTAGRGQDSLSAGGTAWECLVAWALNLWLIGSYSIVYKRASDVPRAVRDALTVTYGSVNANTESDLVAVTYPHDDGALSRVYPTLKEAVGALDDIAAKRFKDLSVAVVQTKTNWNDNAQIPMLWDMIYHSTGFESSVPVTVGVNARHVKNLRSFRYAFVVVPSNANSNYAAKNLCVARVSKLSGGNYWGRPSQSGVAASLRDIFKRARIGPDGGTAIRESLEIALPELRTTYDYFGL